MNDYSENPLEPLVLPVHAPSPAAPKSRRAKGQDLTPRGLVLGWCLFLLISWATIYHLNVLWLPRWLIFSSLLGMMVLWPLLRLSQVQGEHRPMLQGGRRESAPSDGGSPQVGETGAGRMAPALSGSSAKSVLLDWLCLNLVFQSVLWPLHIAAQWSALQTLTLNGAVAGWSLLTGLLVAMGCQTTTSLGRCGAMVLCLLLLLGEPLLILAAGFFRSYFHIAGNQDAAVSWTMHVSPIDTVWRLTSSAPTWSPLPWTSIVLSVVTAGVVGWLMLALMARGRTPGGL